MTNLVYFTRSIERKLFLFTKSFIFISDENGLMNSETREHHLVVSGYSFENIFVKFCFVRDHVAIFTVAHKGHSFRIKNMAISKNCHLFLQIQRCSVGMELFRTRVRGRSLEISQCVTHRKSNMPLP